MKSSSGKRSRNIISSFSYPVEKIEIIEQAEEAAKAKGMSLSQYIVSTFEQMQKNLKGSETPISVEYRALHQEPLDKYLDERFVTIQQFIEEFKQTDDKRLERYQALGYTIAAAAKQVSYHRATGKYLLT